MRVLLVNKFLYAKGGSETYVFKLGSALTERGHAVEYFGLADERNCVGNEVDAYVSDIDFNTGIKKNLTAPLRIIYNGEARRKIRRVLDTFQPDAVHFNNIQFHLTPSIILEVEKYRRRTGRKVTMVYTAHDYQLICPSHGLFGTDLRPCERCLGGNYAHCLRTKCVKGSRMKSLLGMVDAYVWKHSKAYSYVDHIICPSAFLKKKLDTQPRFADKTVAIHNFMEPVSLSPVPKEGYVLEFGHLSRDKGTLTLLEAAKRMPQVRFVFAGYGAAEKDIAALPNADYVGFQTGEELQRLIQQAAVSVYPSEWYENCPFSVIESQMYGTPVIGSRMGGIPELIREGETGLLFQAGNADELEEKLRYLLETAGELDRMTENCKTATFETLDTYCEKLLRLYEE
ncbi:MAG: glycosyltransferase family 4 protein [Clostridia bacterium]|nr:glycosyltransferase family 4 protein [Clostridia bacterium]